jgi:peptide/nickel transport system substrate-binding protein
MQRFICPLLAAVSLWIGWQVVEVFSRPRYGGALRIETHEKVSSLDPSEWSAVGFEPIKEKLISLIFERLVQLDENGHPQPALAVSWQHDAKYKRWRFHLRTDVKFHDGSILTPELAATALRAFTNEWKPGAQGEILLIESDKSRPDLLYDLAKVSHSIFLRGADKKVFGTGPFQLDKWDTGRNLVVLVANEQHWAGPPFLDSLAITMGRPLEKQLTDLKNHDADFIEFWPYPKRQLPEEDKVWVSSSRALIAVVFERGRLASENAGLREALALSIDRSRMHRLLEQGEIAGSLLPQNLSGYAFLFSTKKDVDKAKELVAKMGPTPLTLALAYDASDPLASSLANMADRIKADAGAAGITINPSSRSTNPDIRLVRLPIRLSMPASALTDLFESLHLADIEPPLDRTSIESLYAAENVAISSYRVIPLFHVPEIFGYSPQLKTGKTMCADPFDEWRFGDMWLETKKP